MKLCDWWPIKIAKSKKKRKWPNRVNGGGH